MGPGRLGRCDDEVKRAGGGMVREDLNDFEMEV
jgi:hypothetical protein